MRVLTLNTWNMGGAYRRRWDRITDAVLDLAIDLCCFQEIGEVAVLERISRQVRLPHAMFHERTGLAVLCRWPLAHERFVSFTSPPAADGETRGALLARVEAGADLWVGCTHLSYRPEQSQWRREQAAELLANVSVGDTAWVLAGDFNDVPESEPITAIERRGFVDCYEKMHPYQPGHTWSARNPLTALQVPQLPDRRIDYIFVNDRLDRRLIRCEVVLDHENSHGIFASDHFGVLAEIA